MANGSRVRGGNLTSGLPLNNAEREAVCVALWGSTPSCVVKKAEWRAARLKRLDAYFGHYQRTTRHMLAKPKFCRLQSDTDLLYFVDLLKSNPELPRKYLKDYCTRQGAATNPNNPQTQSQTVGYEIAKAVSQTAMAQATGLGQSSASTKGGQQEPLQHHVGTASIPSQPGSGQPQATAGAQIQSSGALQKTQDQPLPGGLSSHLCRNHSPTGSSKSDDFTTATSRRASSQQATMYMLHEPSKTRPTCLINGARIEANGPLRPLDIDSALSLACRVLLCINVNRSTEDTSDAVSPGQTEEIWWPNMSLQQFIQETIPLHIMGAEETASQIKASQFNVRHLEKYVGVKIEWTRNIHEHLLLDITTSVKKLYVFQLAGFLETTYEVTRGDAIEDALKDKSRTALKDTLTL